MGRPIKIIAPDTARYAVVRRGEPAWSVVLAMSSHRQRLVFERVGVAQFERDGEDWKRIEPKLLPPTA